jgi:excisionase family DNA binding protein
MQCYLKPEELAQHLKVEVMEILSLIEQGKLRAIRIGDSIRIPEAELERLPVTCAAGPTATESLPDGSIAKFAIQTYKSRCVLRESHILLVFERSKVSSVRSQIELRNGTRISPRWRLYAPLDCRTNMPGLATESGTSQIDILRQLVHFNAPRRASPLHESVIETGHNRVGVHANERCSV